MGEMIMKDDKLIMNSGIFDKNGKEVKIGDTLVFPYTDPMGILHDTEDFREVVVFKYGCYGFESQTRFIPLMEWMETREGDYVSNCGNKVVYTEKYTFWVMSE